MTAILVIGSDGTFALDGVAERFLTPREVACLFGVDPKTVNRWADAGKLTFIHTPGGQRRYREVEVNALRNSG
ncbi:BldC family transcriptional regulator [Streptosporangium sp. NPDC051023]|uniref:BldC family transcriptional regulator n=1 Tax=Streptosporangium sp. NPDC051023 TaxID=3155410 RepID=UPI00344ED036